MSTSAAMNVEGRIIDVEEPGPASQPDDDPGSPLSSPLRSNQVEQEAADTALKILNLTPGKRDKVMERIKLGDIEMYKAVKMILARKAHSKEMKLARKARSKEAVTAYQERTEAFECLTELHVRIRVEPPTPPTPGCLMEFKNCCERLKEAWIEMESNLDNGEELGVFGEFKDDICQMKADVEEKYRGKGGGVNQIGGAIRARIFSIRRPSIRRFLTILLCCLRSVARTCKFAADIVKLILAILTIGATVGVSSFTLLYLAKAVQALGCAGWSAISGATADFCSCALGATAAGVIAGPTVGQVAGVGAGMTAAAGLIFYLNFGRVRRIMGQVRQLREAGEPDRARDQAQIDREIAGRINGMWSQTWGEWFDAAGLLSEYGQRILDYLCNPTFRGNVDEYFQSGVPSDLRLLIYEISIMMALNDPRVGGLIGTRVGDSTGDPGTLNTLIEEAAAGSGQATIAEWIRVRRDEMRTALYAFNNRNFSVETWTTAVRNTTTPVINMLIHIRSLGAEAARRFFTEARELLRRLWPESNADTLSDEAVMAILLDLAASSQTSEQDDEEMGGQAPTPPSGSGDDLMAGTNPDGGGYPRRRRTKRRSKSKRRTKSRRRRTLRKTSKRTRKTNVRRKFTRKSTKKLSRRRSRKLSRK